jgi:hypothetical protein
MLMAFSVIYVCSLYISSHGIMVGMIRPMKRFLSKRYTLHYFVSVCTYVFVWFFFSYLLYILFSNS